MNGEDEGEVTSHQSRQRRGDSDGTPGTGWKKVRAEGWPQGRMSRRTDDGHGRCRYIGSVETRASRRNTVPNQSLLLRNGVLPIPFVRRMQRQGFRAPSSEHCAQGESSKGLHSAVAIVRGFLPPLVTCLHYPLPPLPTAPHCRLGSSKLSQPLVAYKIPYHHFHFSPFFPSTTPISCRHLSFADLAFQSSHLFTPQTVPIQPSPSP